MIYLDHAATGLPRNPEAIGAFHAAAADPNAARGRHRGLAETTRAIDEARTRVAGLVGGGTTVFTSGTTYALNQAISGLSMHRVLIDPLAHDAARLPLARAGVQVQILPHDENGRIDLAKVTREWPQHVDLLVVMHGANANGVVQPAAELTAIAHKHGAKVIVDAAQTVGLIDTTVLAEADMVCFAAHKWLRGPPGIGALVIRGDLPLRPLVVGATMLGNNLENLPYPARLEAGTGNEPGAIAMGHAAATMQHWDAKSMTDALKDAVRDAQRVWSGELPIVGITLAGRDPAVVAESLERDFGIVVRSGRNSAKLAHDALKTGQAGTVRLSAGAATSRAELEALRDALKTISH